MTAGFTLSVLGIAENDPVICIDCARCGGTVCEASPETIERDPAWLTRRLEIHERFHAAHTDEEVRAAIGTAAAWQDPTNDEGSSS